MAFIYLSFSSGDFPSLLKMARMVPIFKEDSELEYQNYRPISLLSNIEKILKKLMHKRVYQFPTENKVIYDLQFRFEQNFSTAYVVTSFTENIRQALDKRYIGCGVFADLQKAFNTVDREILLTKLNHCIFGASNDCFKSYLSNRQQLVSINVYDSGLTETKCGIPKGSVLGPLLFLQKISDFL